MGIYRTVIKKHGIVQLNASPPTCAARWTQALAMLLGRCLCSLLLRLLLRLLLLELHAYGIGQMLQGRNADLAEGNQRPYYIMHYESRFWVLGLGCRVYIGPGLLDVGFNGYFRGTLSGS